MKILIMLLIIVTLMMKVMSWIQAQGRLAGGMQDKPHGSGRLDDQFSICREAAWHLFV